MKRTEIEYEIFAGGSWVAASDDLDTAMYCAQQYREEGRVVVNKVTKGIEVVAILSKLQSDKEQA